MLPLCVMQRKTSPAYRDAPSARGVQVWTAYAGGQRDRCPVAVILPLGPLPVHPPAGVPLESRLSPTRGAVFPRTCSPKSETRRGKNDSAKQPRVEHVSDAAIASAVALGCCAGE